MYDEHTVFQSSTACNLCLSPERRVVATKGRKRQPLITAICTGCGLVQSEPIPAKEELRKFYAKKYRALYKGTLAPRSKHIVRYAEGALARISRLQRHVPQGARLLDVGSGSGEFVYVAKREGYDVSGIEPHAGYSEYTRRVFGISVMTATIDEAPIAAGSLDAVTISHVVEHLPDPLQALSTLNKWLRHGGILLVEVPDMDRVPRELTEHFHYAHIYNFNHRTLRAMLEKAGFMVEEGEDNKATTLVARKVSEPVLSMAISMPDNYADLWQKMTTPPDFIQSKLLSYKRFFLKCRRYPVEIIKGLLMRDPKVIVEVAWRKWKNSNSAQRILLVGYSMLGGF